MLLRLLCTTLDTILNLNMRRVLLSIMLCMSCLCIPVLSASSFSVQELPFRINFTSSISYDSGTIANNAKATAELVISKAPIYQNFWFKTSVLIISIGLIFLIPLIRDRRAFNGLQWIKAIFNKRTASLNSEVKQESYNRELPIEVATLDQNEHTIKLGSLSKKIAPKNPITELSPESYSVKELFHELISIFEDHAKSKGVAVEYWILPDVPAFVVGDRKCMLQVLASLVANAMRYKNKEVFRYLQRRYRSKVAIVSFGLQYLILEQVSLTNYKSKCLISFLKMIKAYYSKTHMN